MPINQDDDPWSEGNDRIVAEAMTVADRARETVKRIEQARDAQPQRLAAARAAADEARGWSLVEEPWAEQVSTLPTYGEDGDACGSLTLPNIVAKELWGARLAFDILDAGDDEDRINEVQSRYFKLVEGDTRLAFLLAMSALATIADTVVPPMLDELETHAGNWDVRVMIADARRKAWEGRVSALREATDASPVADDHEPW